MSLVKKENHIDFSNNNWQSLRIKDLITKIGSGVTPKGGSEVYVDKGITFLRSQNVYNDGLRIDKVSFITDEVNDRMKNSQLKPFDILINITGASIGRTCVFPISVGKANINQHIIYLRVKKRKVDFLSYYLKSQFIKDYIMSVQAGSSKEALNMGQTLNIPVSIPNPVMQTKLASYLDANTEIIDKKIVLLKKKIDKYQDLRKSLINKTITKGLNSNVKLKESGIKWIDEIPENWEVKRFKDICFKNHTGGTPTTAKTEMFRGDNVWVTIADVSDSKFVSDSKLKLTKNAITETNIPITPKGSLIYSFKLTVGKIAFTKTDIYTNEALISILPNKKIELSYHYYMLPIFLLLNATENIYGAKMLNQKLILNSLLLHPPKEEQKEIAAFLDNKTTKIDNIIRNIKKQIDRLVELRKTLINDIVTGKLKVIEG
jgi:type I restriction enzyme S subunit